MTETNQEQQPVLGSRLAYLNDDVAKIIDALGHTSQAVRELHDHQLLALAAWTETGGEDGHHAIRAECKRRAEQGRTFAAYLDQPTLGELLRRLVDPS